MVTCYAARRRGKSALLCEAFAAGCGGQVVYGATELRPGPAFFYGMRHKDAALIRRCRAEGRDWFYADNGYFRRGSYFRVTRNAWQHSGEGDAAPDRWQSLGLSLEPWAPRPNGDVIVALQSAHFFAVRDECRDAWLRDVLARLRTATARRIVVREKPRRPEADDFARVLNRAWAVVGRSSNCLVDALLAGVPAFPTQACAALSCGTLEEIERPRRPPDRGRWARVLAANQWTLEEIRAGLAWQALTG